MAKFLFFNVFFVLLASYTNANQANATVIKMLDGYAFYCNETNHDLNVQGMFLNRGPMHVNAADLDMYIFVRFGECVLNENQKYQVRFAPPISQDQNVTYEDRELVIAEMNSQKIYSTAKINAASFFTPAKFKLQLAEVLTSSELIALHEGRSVQLNLQAFARAKKCMAPQDCEWDASGSFKVTVNLKLKNGTIQVVP